MQRTSPRFDPDTLGDQDRARESRRMVLAILLGRCTTGRMNAPTFLRCIHLGLMVVGSILLLQAFA